MEAEEEKVLSEGGRLTGSMIGRRRVLTTWAVDEAWERFSTTRQAVVQKSFRILGLALPIDGSCDMEISLKGIDQTYLRDGLLDWRQGSLEGEDTAEVEQEASGRVVGEVGEGEEVGERVEVGAGVEAEAGEGSRVGVEEEHSFLTGDGELNEAEDELDIFFE